MSGTTCSDEEDKAEGKKLGGRSIKHQSTEQSQLNKFEWTNEQLSKIWLNNLPTEQIPVPQNKTQLVSYWTDV